MAHVFWTAAASGDVVIGLLLQFRIDLADILELATGVVVSYGCSGAAALMVIAPLVPACAWRCTCFVFVLGTSVSDRNRVQKYKIRSTNARRQADMSVVAQWSPGA